MKIEDFYCKNFRNIEELLFSPDDGMNVIYGDNANGKTNIIEGIWLFTGAKSFRTKTDSAFVKIGSRKAELSLNFFSSGIKKEAKIEIENRRTALLNENTLSSPSMLAGEFNAVIFSPSDLEIIGGAPAMRRNFTDIAIGQLYPSFISSLRNYKRAVIQRNKIIKDFKFDGSISVMLEAFEKEIAENGRKIINARKKFLEISKNYLTDIYSGLSSGKEELCAEYISNCKEEEIEEKLKFSRKEDMFSGITTVGPHRDDIVFKINGISVRTYGSQGQKRSAALALKLSQAEVIKKITGEYPVCLLDDVMSELDPGRQNYILNHIKDMQSFITCCDPSNVKNLKKGKIFRIENGSVKN